MKRLLLILTMVLFVLLPLIAMAETYNVRFNWNANPPHIYKPVDGYRLYVGSTSGEYGDPIDVGNVTTYLIEGVLPGDWYAVLSAYNSKGESVTTGEVHILLEIPIELIEAPDQPAGLVIEIEVILQ